MTDIKKNPALTKLLLTAARKVKEVRIKESIKSSDINQDENIS